MRGEGGDPRRRDHAERGREDPEPVVLARVEADEEAVEEERLRTRHSHLRAEPAVAREAVVRGGLDVVRGERDVRHEEAQRRDAREREGRVLPELARASAGAIESAPAATAAATTILEATVRRLLFIAGSFAGPWGASRVVAPAIAEARRRASGPLSYAFLPRDRARFTIARSAAPISRMTTSAIT